jgi:hypothetical protein
MSRRVRWVGHINRMGKKKMKLNMLFVGNQRDRDHQEGGCIIISWILEK